MEQRLPDPAIAARFVGHPPLEAAATAINQLLSDRALHQQVKAGDPDPESRGLTFGKDGFACLWRSANLRLYVESHDPQLVFGLVTVYGPIFHTLTISNQYVTFQVGE